MKFKIFCVVVIAASIAIILGLALTGKEDATPDQKRTGSERVDARPAPQPQPMLAPEAIPENVVEIKKAKMESVAELKEQEQAAAPDKIDRLRTATGNPGAFSRFDINDRVAVLSLELKLNEEQEVMLSSYLEAKHKFLRDRNVRDFASAIMNVEAIPVNSVAMNLRPEITLDEMTNAIDIMSLELKEIKGLREKFLTELTKQQREKFDAMPISGSF